MNKTIETVGCLVYNFALLAGTTYLIVNYNWSVWSYALAALFLVSKRDKD